MKYLIVTFALVLSALSLNAQIELRTEYIGSSKYKDADGKKDGAKGSAQITSLGANIPLSVKINSNQQPTVWSLALNSTYTALHNKGIPKNVAPSEILNTGVSLIHLRPINEKWSMLAALGAGSFTAHARLADIRMTNIMMNGAAIFICQLRPNLKLGGGAAINNSLGYPMIFPALYLEWKLPGKYEVDVQLANAFEISAGMRLTDYMKLKAIFTANGAMALEKIDGERMMFSHQYMTAGFRPEFNFGKFTVPIDLGVTVSRLGKYEERKLKTLFKDDEDEPDSNFNLAPYLSLGLRYNF